MIVIRADANPVIGSGHIMRCLSIATALRSVGVDCLFVCADDFMRAKIETAGFDVKVLSTDYSRMNMETDLFLKILLEYDVSDIIVDSYFVTDSYLESLSKIYRVTYVDDYMEHAYPVSRVINYNIYADEEEYVRIYSGKNTLFALGTGYVPLRNEFCNVPNREIRKKIEKVLVLTGGADPFHVALNVAKMIDESVEYPKFFIVAGSLSGDIDILRNYAAKNANIRLFVGVNDIHKLMLDSDYAISAAGSTLYELCACGTPFSSYTFADNQLRAANEFKKRNLAECLGDVRGSSNVYNAIFDAIAWMNDSAERTLASEKLRRVTDGKGALRIAELFKNSIH